MSNVISIAGAREAPKAVQNRMDTQVLTPLIVNQWRIPIFQRPLRVNAKVRAAAEEMKISEVIDGIITLGMVRGKDTTVYVVDGQHRLEAFKLSGLKEILADLRFMLFDNMAEMSKEFTRLQSHLVGMRPDDNLRGMELVVPAVAKIKKHCEFVGYDHVRRGGASSAIVSMSALVRCWASAQSETPSASSGSSSAAERAQNLEDKSVDSMIQFLNIAYTAWGRDPEYYRLWSNLNLTMCMWMWNRLVVDRDRVGKRHVLLNAAQFKHCLMGLTADGDYVEWLRGRNLTERDRSPCYARIKALFIRRLSEGEGKPKAVLPQPAWAFSNPRTRYVNNDA